MIRIKMGNLYKNAGILGLYRILQESDFDENDAYYVGQDFLEVDESIFADHDFGQLFMNALISKYENTPLTRWINSTDAYNSICAKDEAVTSREKLKKDVVDVRPLNRKLCWTIAADILPYEKAKALTDIARRAMSLGMLRSQKASDIKPYLEKFGLPQIEKKNKNASFEDKLRVALDLREWLRDKDCFEACQLGIILKDIVSLFWYREPLFSAVQGGGANVSAKVKTHGSFAAAYNEAFPEIALPNCDKGKILCVECGAPIRKKADSVPITFTTNIWSDLDRKTSAFWNHGVDAALCPICAIIYSCAPIGFTEFGRNYMFINCNVSLRALINSNSAKDEDSSREEGETAAHWFNKVTEIATKEAANSVLGNIQVAIMQADSGRYRFENITASAAQIIRGCSGDLDVLANANAWILLGNTKLNIYEQTAYKVINLADVYDILDICIKHGFVGLSGRLVNVQTAILTERYKHHNKEDLEMTEQKLKELKKQAFGAGRGFREAYMAYKATDNDRSLNGIAYPLLNSIKCSDGSAIYDILLRTYNSMGKAAPGLVLDIMSEKSDEARLVGYSFVAGMLSKPKVKTEEENKED